LAREGVITPGSEAAKDLSKADLQRRQKAEAEKKAKLQNPNCFVSTTRLCVRNLPLTTTEKELTKVFSNAGAVCDKKPALVKKVLILRSKERVDGTGKGRSLGFGFVEFANHKEALTALRSTNNNPDVFGPNRRPIVEFSIENSLALKAKQQRMVRSKNKEKRSEEEVLVTKTHKERRIEKALRRREKRQARKINKSGKDSTGDKNAPKDTSPAAGQNKANYPVKKTNSIESSLKKKKKHFLTKQQHKAFDQKDKTSSKSLEKDTNPGKSTPFSKTISNRRNAKRKATDKNEEKEFNAIVQKYKSKLFGESGSNAKRSRWFE
jgi:nucleolar protein 4